MTTHRCAGTIVNNFKNILNEFGELDICLFSSGTYEPKDEQSIDPDKIKNVINSENQLEVDVEIRNYYLNNLLEREVVKILS